DVGQADEPDDAHDHDHGQQDGETTRKAGSKLHVFHTASGDFQGKCECVLGRMPRRRDCAAANSSQMLASPWYPPPIMVSVVSEIAGGEVGLPRVLATVERMLAVRISAASGEMKALLTQPLRIA
ncbi:hypothetical protein, partial [Achromobacter sp.]|uniref:hypothetical protein n=1 Tax=Achromobacter sp. TaxID=134375 RepID=UPI003D04138A